MNLLEGNELIRKFMGLEIATKQVMFDNRIYYETPFLPVTYAACEDHFAFHDEWNWLMPVVEYIETIEDEYHGRFGVHISSNNCCIQATNFRSYERIAEPPYYFNDDYDETKIKASYKAVVNFIKWYNQK